MPQKSNFGSPPAKPGVYLDEIINRCWFIIDILLDVMHEKRLVFPCS